MDKATKVALHNLMLAAQQLNQVIEESGYCLSDSMPNYIADDIEDFAYEITSAVTDEIDNFYKGED